MYYKWQTQEWSPFPEGAYIRARIRLQTTVEGGRKTAFLSEYRPMFFLGHYTDDGQRQYYDAQIPLEETQQLAPGNSGLARLAPYSPEFWHDLIVGSLITFHEGSPLIGTAEVIELLPRAPVQS